MPPTRLPPSEPTSHTNEAASEKKNEKNGARATFNKQQKQNAWKKSQTAIETRS